ncbi:4-hydroxybenzoate octaprenyltransferase [Devosia pacifica]|uniref:4-hydroxybenzoate octaprenyltransferase n=1 Tax=Devosia pacifica TaxID=1335967 RepID=A0A918VWQ8_9HYPH|nr:4-hydroxybenzoate octaprenyltransferase [Devosia pacifica]GHA30649.1 4-hydroxybenzoate octaprenyltransferase [Devosia pacifica]
MPKLPKPGSLVDAPRGNWVDSFAPDWLLPYARLARWDRPIGFWLLFWPCAFSLGMAAVADPGAGFDWVALILMFIGAILMRGAGCTFNDIVDRDIDAKVARTRLRPIPSGQVTRTNAVAFMVLQALLGFIILLQFNFFTIGLGIASLGLIAIYPFMKRITWWPQLFLGLVFSWGALVGWSSQMGSLGLPPILLYFGTICWVIAYDTIYALQDREDDALIGVKSTARLWGDSAKAWVGAFYAFAASLWLVAGLLAGGSVVFIVGLLVVAGLFTWQVVSVDPANPGNALARFWSNYWVGLIFTLTFIAEWLI